MPFVVDRRTIGSRKKVQIFDNASERRDANLAIVGTKRDAGDRSPILPGPQCVQQFHECDLALETHHRIEAWRTHQKLSGLETRVVSPDREMAGNARVAKGCDSAGEIRGHVLENEREADDFRLIPANVLEDVLRIGSVRQDPCLVTARVDSGHEVAETQVVLVLKTDQQNLLSARVRVARRQPYLIRINDSHERFLQLVVDRA